MQKILKQEYTIEFKERAVKHGNVAANQIGSGLLISDAGVDSIYPC